ncbi:MAG: ParB/RepB/Spo0J family partition protein [Nitrospirales bacterium]|nr:ParB/RepB/Spo0J family partition protein [Nitrospirales bacterium]
MEKKALGKGLQALLPGRETAEQGSAQTIQDIPLAQILPNPHQPRKHFSGPALAELAESVEQSGVLQPILVRLTGDGKYELIAGERRLRAAKLAKLHSIPALVKNSSDEQSMLLSLVENIQRQDLNPIEEAKTYLRLMKEFGLTQEHVAVRVGKERSSVANLTRLMSLPKTIQSLVESEQISLGHAKVLLGVKDVQTQEMIAQKIVTQTLSVRQAEDLAARHNSPREISKKNQPVQRALELETQLRQILGTRVTITRGKRGGKIAISYFSQDDLTRIAEVILS